MSSAAASARAQKAAKMKTMRTLDPREAHHRLTQTLELLAVQKELNKAGDAAQHPELKPEELEGRFWRRMRARKDAQWKYRNGTK